MQDSPVRYILQREERLSVAVREEETLKEGKEKRTQLDVWEEHAEAVLNKGLRHTAT